MKKTVLKVNINCNKCKTAVMKAVAKLPGIDELSVDDEKGTLTVIGDIDPVLVTNKVRKIGKVAEIISVGPPKPPPEPKPNPIKHCLPICCKECELVAVGFVTFYDGGRSCSIL